MGLDELYWPRISKTTSKGHRAVTLIGYLLGHEVPGEQDAQSG